MSNEEALQYDEDLPKCQVFANGEIRYRSFGTGKLTITSISDPGTRSNGKTKVIDEGKRLNGIIEFTVPSPAHEDASRILTFKGEFSELYLNSD